MHAITFNEKSVENWTTIDFIFKENEEQTVELYIEGTYLFEMCIHDIPDEIIDHLEGNE